MNLSIRFGITAFLCFIFYACTSQKKMVTQANLPFKITNASYSHWVGGQPGVKGISISIALNKSQIVLDSVYFKNRGMQLKRNKQSKSPTFVGTFNYPYKNPNLIISSNSKEEYGNTAPKIPSSIPFRFQACFW